MRSLCGHPEEQDWRDSYQQELTGLWENGTYTLVERPHGVTVLPCKVVFKAKLDEFGNVSRCKSRVVVLGCLQRPGAHFNWEQLYAPVCAYSSLRVLFSLAAQLDWRVYTFDISTAFLNARLPEEIYMEQPPDAWEGPPALDASGKPLVCRLLKSLYGLKQAPRLWRELMKKHLLAHGWEQLYTDASLYVRCVDGKLQALLLVYVDDMQLTPSPTFDVEAFFVELNVDFTATRSGETTLVLGIRVERDRAAGTLTLSQGHYLTRLLQDAGMMDCNPATTPLEHKLAAHPDSPLLSAEAATAYRSAVGALQFAASATRPDLAVAVSNLSRNLKAPTEADAAALKRAHRYIKGTLELGITFHHGDRPFMLHGWCDADWGGDVATSRSTTGYILHLHGGPVSWKTALQPSVAGSSAEAEYVSAHFAIQQTLQLRHLLQEIGFPQQRTPLLEDNEGAIFTANNDGATSKLRHVRRRFHSVREQVSTFRTVELVPCPTQDMVADILTKALAHPRFGTLARLALGAPPLRHSRLPSAQH